MWCFGIISSPRSNTSSWWGQEDRNVVFWDGEVPKWMRKVLSLWFSVVNLLREAHCSSGTEYKQKECIWCSNCHVVYDFWYDFCSFFFSLPWILLRGRFANSSFCFIRRNGIKVGQWGTLCSWNKHINVMLLKLLSASSLSVHLELAELIPHRGRSLLLYHLECLPKRYRIIESWFYDTQCYTPAGSAVQVNSFLMQTSCKQGQRCFPLNTAGPDDEHFPSALGHWGRKLRNMYSNKNRKRNKDNAWNPHCGERCGKTQCSTAALFHDTKGRTCLLHLRYSHGKVCAEGKQSVKQSIKHKHL